MLGISADEDSRLLRSMKIETNFEVSPFKLENYPTFFSSETSYSQGIGTKLRNRLLKFSIVLPFENKQISVTYLKLLVQNVPKDIHGITLSDISPDDRQNCRSLEKIMEPRVTQALQMYIIDSGAIVAYSKLCHFATSSFLDEKLNPLVVFSEFGIAFFSIDHGKNG